MGARQPQAVNGEITPQDGEGVPLRFLPKYDAMKRAKKGPWRSNYQHPVHVPEILRRTIESGWFDEEWVQHEPYSGEDEREKQKFFQQFPVLQHDGDPWSSGVWKRLKNKLDAFPHDCAAFGSTWKKGVRFELESVHLISDEQLNDKYCSVSLEHECEDILAFHGTQLSSMKKILKHGFDPTRSKDCWYGNGCYFSNNMTYAQHYIGSQTFSDGEWSPAHFRGKDPVWGIRLPEEGHTIYLLACLLRPGKIKVVPPDTTPAGSGYKGPFRDKGCAPGFHSHVAWVTPQSEGSIGFRPLKEKNMKEGTLIIKEFVIFDPARILPRYIVGVKRVS